MDTMIFLENERLNLQTKIECARDKGDVGTYKNLILAYKEILRLEEDIKREEKIKENNTTKWELKWSKYKTDNDTPMISVWEQNNNGEIRNTQQFRLYDEKLLKLIISLMSQLDISNFKDENDFNLKMNSSYLNLKNYLNLANFYNYNISSTNNKLNHYHEPIDNTNENILYFDIDKEKCTIMYNKAIYRYTYATSLAFIVERIESLCDKDVLIYGDYHGIGLYLADLLKEKGFKVLDTRVVNTNFKNNNIRDYISKCEH